MHDRSARPNVQILLVDDNPGDVELTTLRLQEGNIPSDITVAEDGIEALAYLRREGAYEHALRPDLILLDLNMPRKDGRETLAELALDPELSHIPVVIITASESERSLLETYHLASNRYFVKPVDFKSFLSLVESLHILAAQSDPAPLAIVQDSRASDEIIRVLLAEDNPGDVVLTEAYLQEAKQVVCTLDAVDGFAETLARLEAGAYDILLLDLSVLEGRDLRESIETFKRALHIPVVVLTGLNDERFGIEAVKAGAEDYLIKGRVDSDLLVRSIRFATERHRRKQLQEHMHQAQRLEEIGRLAGGVAHDFNNLLTAIMGFTELARDAEPSGSELPSHLDCISQAAGRAAELTQQLLGFARKQIIQPRVMNLNTCVDDIERMLRRLITADIELSTSPAEKLWQVRVDPGQIEQVIVNLVVNSRDAMPNGGRIEIETANIYLGEREAQQHKVQAGNYVMLSVRDNGEGMSEEVKAHIFEPFFTTKEVGKGTGLGLATCYGIVQQNGGDITVESAPGKGATFRVYFPSLQEAVITTVGSTETAVPPSRGETILLVEDEAVVRELTALTLRKFGYQVLEAADGAEALRLAAAHGGPVDLLLTDLIMPQMGGKAVAERLLARYPGTKVLFVSGYSDGVVDGESFLEEATAFLQKPFTPRSLARKVLEMLTPQEGAK